MREKISKQESQRQLLMMLVAANQITVNLMDELPEYAMFRQDFKSQSNKYQKVLLGKVEHLYGLMDKTGDQKVIFEQAYNQCQDAIDVLIKCVKNGDIEPVLAVLKALNDGEILQLPEGKHKKIASQLKPIEI